MIADLHRERRSVRAIADAMGRSPSTISHELRRNVGADGHYRPSVSERLAADLRHHSRDITAATTPAPSTCSSPYEPTLRGPCVPERLSGQLGRPDGTVLAGPRTPGAGPSKPRRADRLWTHSVQRDHTVRPEPTPVRLNSSGA